jgi:hypothetical protein
MIKIRKITVEPTDVYDITVPATNTFLANNIVVHNCGEIALPTHPLNDVNDGAPIKKNIKMTKADYEKYLIWRKNNPKTPLPNA